MRGKFNGTRQLKISGGKHYQYRWYFFLVSLPSILFQIFFGAVIFWTVDKVFTEISLPDTLPPPIILLVYFNILFFLELGLTRIYVAFVRIIDLLFTTLTLTSEGIIYRQGPANGILCDWDDVDRVEKKKTTWGISHSDVLYLKKAEPFGLNLNIFNRLAAIKKTGFDPADCFQGLARWGAGQMGAWRRSWRIIYRK